MSNESPSTTETTSAARGRNLRSQGRFAEAAAAFRQACAEKPDAFVASSLVFCLRKAGELDQAVTAGQDAVRAYPDDPWVRRELAWALYDRNIKNGPVEGEEPFLAAARLILDLSGSDLAGRRTLFRVIEHYKELGDWAAVVEWCCRLDGSSFPDEAGDAAGKRASDRKLWHYARVKALFHTGRFAECRAAAQEALQDAPRDVHFLRWAALALGGLDQVDAAIEGMRRIIGSGHREWFLHSDLGELLASSGKKEDALQAFVAAALAPSEPQMKVRLFQTLGDLLIEMGREETGRCHLRLACAVRREAGWTLPQDLLASLHLAGVPHGEQGGDPCELLAQCRSFWEDQLNRSLPRIAGRIKALLGGGKAGFIAAGGQDYYFKFADFRGPADQIRQGLDVVFLATTGFDRKKQREGLQALDIRPAAAGEP